MKLFRSDVELIGLFIDKWWRENVPPRAEGVSLAKRYLIIIDV